MHLVRRYQRVFEAESMASALREQGINCSVVGHHTQAAIGVEGGRLPWFGYDLIVLRKSDVQIAKSMVQELESELLEPEEGWEDASRPDLSVLEGTGLVVRCGSCDAPLPLDERIEACPSCAEPVDVVERLVAEHGPEVLDACYGVDAPSGGVCAQSAPGGYDPSRSRVRCAGCGAVLGDEISGRCPSCGTLYDQRDMRGR